MLYSKVISLLLYVWALTHIVLLVIAGRNHRTIAADFPFSSEG